MFEKVDIIITYVNGNDVNWLSRYNRAAKLFNEKYGNYNIEEGNIPEELKLLDYGTLKYLIRSVDKNLPFVNNVFLVVQSFSQVPDWINTETVKIVLHEDFIPKEYLPTFNSMTIDMFMHKIPGLSNRFIKIEDDMIITRKLTEYSFFDGNTTKETMEFRDLHNLNYSNPAIVYQKMWLNASNLVKRHFNEPESDHLYYRTNHGVSPLIKSDIEEFITANENEILNSITQFRQPKNFVHWIFRFYTWKKNGMVQNGVNHKYLTFRNKWELIKELDNCDKYDTIVIQEFGFEPGDEKIVETYLNKHFPKNCKYEK